MLFEIHCHTNHSKGTKIPIEVMMSPTEVVRLAKKAGLDALAITDHNVTTAWKEARKEARKQGLLFIPGQEISTVDGHLLGLGLTEAVKNRLTADETLDLIKEQGGFSVAPHPWDIKDDGLKDQCFKADAVEVFNSFAMDRVSNWYTQRRVRKEGKPMVVGSDVHMPDMMGLCANKANAHSMEGIFREIKRNRIKFRTSYAPVGSVVEWTRERMYLSYHDIIKHIDKNYSRPKAYVSKPLMGFFIAHKTRAWNLLGGLAIGVSVLYSGAKMLTY